MNRGNDIGALRALALVGRLGLTIALPVAAGAWFGAFLDHRFGWKGLFVVLGVLAGLVLGAVGVVRLLMKEMSWNR